MKRLLQEAGIDGGRIEMYNIGASDAIKFVAACNEMTGRAMELGPNPLRKKEAIEVE